MPTDWSAGEGAEVGAGAGVDVDACGLVMESVGEVVALRDGEVVVE